MQHYSVVILIIIVLLLNIVYSNSNSESDSKEDEQKLLADIENNENSDDKLINLDTNTKDTLERLTEIIDWSKRLVDRIFNTNNDELITQPSPLQSNSKIAQITSAGSDQNNRLDVENVSEDGVHSKDGAYEKLKG